MTYLQITIPAADPSLQEILIALLPGLGYEGFEQQEAALQAFLPEEQFDPAALEALLEQHGLTYTTARLEERNWNEEWEKSFEPVQVEHFCAVRAHFHSPIPGVAHELIITPKMSFGTGHHATTYMMLDGMQHLDFHGRRVLDFGTGTGVLAILAERLGASQVIAVDNDPWSIENARENLAANHCSRITVLKADTIPSPGADHPLNRLTHSAAPGAAAPFDLILANINKHIIIEQLPALGQQLKAGGVILLSGLLENDFEDIENEALKNNLPISVRMTKGPWICLKAEKKAK
jgi:ribosomal protein L11 methyltransferase